MSSIPIFVINLDEDVERLAGISRRLGSLGLDFERFPAHRGSRIPERWRPHFHDETGSPATDLSDGELGCWASHLDCMARFLSGNAETAVILEDDAVPHPDFGTVLAGLGRLPRGWDVLKFSGPLKSVYVPVGGIGAFELVQYWRIPLSAVGYAVSRQGAGKLVAHRGPRRLPFDGELRSAYVRGIVTYGLVPPPVVHAAGPSSIERTQTRRSRRRKWEIGPETPPWVIELRRFRFDIRRLSFRTWLRCWFGALRVRISKPAVRRAPLDVLQTAEDYRPLRMAPGKVRPGH